MVAVTQLAPEHREVIPYRTVITRQPVIVEQHHHHHHHHHHQVIVEEHHHHPVVVEQHHHVIHQVKDTLTRLFNLTGTRVLYCLCAMCMAVILFVVQVKDHNRKVVKAVHHLVSK